MVLFEMVSFMNASASANIGAMSRIICFDGTQEIGPGLKKFEVACTLDGVKTDDMGSVIEILLSEDIF